MNFDKVVIKNQNKQKAIQKQNKLNKKQKEIKKLIKKVLYNRNKLPSGWKKL